MRLDREREREREIGLIEIIRYIKWLKNADANFKEKQIVNK